MNPQDLQTAQSSGLAPIFYSPNQVMPDAPAASPAQTNLPAKGNWLERNAQTIGGIIGGIGGEILDPFGGGVAGAAAGQGIGQEIKNKTTGTTTNPFEEAALGGAAELTGGVLGRGAKVLAGKASNIADRYGVNLLSQVGGTVDRRTARALDAQGTTRFMSDLGVNPADSKDVSRGVIDTLTPLVNEGVGQAGKVNTTGVTDIADNLIDNHMGLDGISTQKGTAANKLSNSIKNMVNKLNGVEDTNAPPLLKNNSPGDILNPGADPNDTLQTIKSLRSDAARLTGRGKNPLTVTDAARAEADVKNNVADELEDRLYNDGEVAPGIKGAGADSVVTKGLVDDKTISALENVLPDTPKSRQFLDSIKGATSIRELRSAQAPFVNASQMAAEKEAGKATVGATSSTLVKQGIGAAGLAAAPFTGGASAILPAAELALGTDTGKTITGNTLRKASGVLGGVADHTTPQLAGQLSAGDVASQIATQTAASGAGNLFGGQLPAAPPASPASTGSVSDQVAASVASTMNPLMAAKNGSNAGTPSYSDILQAGGIEGLNSYINYRKNFTPQLTDDQQKDWMSAQNAMNDIQSFAKVYENASAKGAGVGQLEILGSKIPGIQNMSGESAIKAYEDNKGDLASSLAQILGGGKNSKAMLTEIKGELPDITDSPQAAAIKMNLIVQRLGSHMQTILSAPATNTPGMLTNFTGQTVPGTVNFSSPQSAMMGLTQ